MCSLAQHLETFRTLPTRNYCFRCMWQKNRFTGKAFHDGRKIEGTARAVLLVPFAFTRFSFALSLSTDDIWLNRLKAIILTSVFFSLILKSLNIHDSVSRPLFSSIWVAPWAHKRTQEICELSWKISQMSPLYAGHMARKKLFLLLILASKCTETS